MKIASTEIKRSIQNLWKERRGESLFNLGEFLNSLENQEIELQRARDAASREIPSIEVGHRNIEDQDKAVVEPDPIELKPLETKAIKELKSADLPSFERITL